MIIIVVMLIPDEPSLRQLSMSKAATPMPVASAGGALSVCELSIHDQNRDNVVVVRNCKLM
jgi:hypothetical protein